MSTFSNSSPTLTHKSAQLESSLPQSSYTVMLVCASAGTLTLAGLRLTLVSSFRFHTLDTHFTRSISSRIKVSNILSFSGKSFFLFLFQRAKWTTLTGRRSLQITLPTLSYQLHCHIYQHNEKKPEQCTSNQSWACSGRFCQILPNSARKCPPQRTLPWSSPEPRGNGSWCAGLPWYLETEDQEGLGPW